MRSPDFEATARSIPIHAARRSPKEVTALDPFGTLAPATLLRLQRAAGNASVTALVQRKPDTDVESSPKKMVQIPSELPWTEVEEAGDNAEAIYARVRKLYELRDKLEKAAKAIRTMKGRRGKDIPVIASNLLSAADGVVNVARVYDDFTGQLKGLPLGEVSSRISRDNKAVKVLALIAALADDSRLSEFVANPTSETAYAWAEDTADVFTRAASVVPENLVFISPMLKGLLSAPANYLRAFKTILDAHLRRIDLAAGISSSKEKVTHAVGGDWEGPMSLVYYDAFTRAPGLREFMQSHRDTDGVNLLEARVPFGVAHLMNLIHREASKRTDWLTFLGSYL